MTGKKVAGISAAVFAIADGLLSFFQNAEWFVQHFPTWAKPMVNAPVAVCLGLAAIFLVLKSAPDEDERKLEAGPQIETRGKASFASGRDTHIGTINNYQGPGAAPTTDNDSRRLPKPRLKVKYVREQRFIFPSEGMCTGTAIAFRNDAISEMDDALDITTHLTFRSEDGGVIQVNEALWTDPSDYNVNIFTSKTNHLVIVGQIPDNDPPTFYTMDVGYDRRLGRWIVREMHELKYGRYELLIEIKAENYRGLFKSTGELSAEGSVWTLPIAVSVATA